MLSLLKDSQQLLNYTPDNFPEFNFGKFEIVQKLDCGTNDFVYLINLNGEKFILRRSILNFRYRELQQEFIHYWYLKDYIGEEHIPPALFVWDTQNKIGGHSGFCITHYYSEFKALKDLSDEEYFDFKDQLEAIIQRMIKMMKERGEVIDFSGNKGKFFFNLMNFRCSENVVVTDIDGTKQVIILDFGRGNFLTRIPILKDLVRIAFIFGLRRELNELSTNYEP